MPKNPLAEVFGFPIEDMTETATNHRAGHLCPYHNSSGPNCTKVSATDPVGVCSIIDNKRVVATCPVRFRQDYEIITHATQFFFEGENPVAITEARLKDGNGKSAGNIDIVLAVLDEDKKVKDFGAIEVQAVYITGNVSNVFNKYMENPASNYAMQWPRKNSPKPDYLSSSRKRLAPQLLYKGSILKEWGKKMAVVVDENFFAQLPELPTCEKGSADIAWLVYRFAKDRKDGRYHITLLQTVYSTFSETISTITKPDIGNVDRFLSYLGNRVKTGKTMGIPEASEVEPEVEPPLGISDDEF